MTSLFNYFVRLSVILSVLPVILNVLPVILSEAKNLFFIRIRSFTLPAAPSMVTKKRFRMTMAGLLQGGCQVSYEIIHILYADRQSEHIRIDSCSDLLFRTEL